MMISARDGGLLHCLVVGPDGDLVALDAAPTVTATADPLGPGRYSAPLPAAHPALDNLGTVTVTWTANTAKRQAIDTALADIPTVTAKVEAACDAKSETIDVGPVEVVKPR